MAPQNKHHLFTVCNNGVFCTLMYMWSTFYFDPNAKYDIIKSIFSPPFLHFLHKTAYFKTDFLSGKPCSANLNKQNILKNLFLLWIVQHGINSENLSVINDNINGIVLYQNDKTRMPDKQI